MLIFYAEGTLNAENIGGNGMKREEPVIFDPDKPLAHYERAKALRIKTDKILDFGKKVSVIAFILGTVCVIYNPAMMALMALFGLLFCLLSAFGCWLKRPLLNLISIPLGMVAAIAAGISGSAIAPFGASVFFLAAAWEVFSINASANFYKLKELPGFPLFDPAMDNITFAAKDRLGTEKYIESEDFGKVKEHIKLVPILEPADEMEEISEQADAEKLPERSAPDPSAAKLIWDEDPIRKKNGGDISDIDLFG